MQNKEKIFKKSKLKKINNEIIPIQTQQPVVQTKNNDSMISSIISNIFQGMAVGTGSQLASRAIDEIIGPKKIEIKTEKIPMCENETDSYNNCMKYNTDDYSHCKELFQLLSKCKNTN